MINGFKPFGSTVIGAKQVKKGLPNQDAYGYESLDNGVQILAVSDGHGGLDYIHSDRGAALAVDVSIRLCRAYFETWSTEKAIEDIRIYLEESLAREIHECWIKCVQDEPDFMEINEYGCTLLVLVCTGNRLYMMQLGDGKIAIVYEDGVVYYPIPRDEFSASNMTRSLSSGQAWLEMKIVDEPLESSIHMIALATDGVENAYPNNYYDDASFFLNLAKVRHEDISQVLPEMLLRATCFSKDDCTVTLLKNGDNMLVESDMTSLEPTILFSEHPLPYHPLIELANEPLNTRLEMAVLILDALAKRNWEVPKALTLKGLYFDKSTNVVDWLSMGPTIKLTVIQLKAWLWMWLNMDIDFTELCEAKRALALYQKQLRYDYKTQHFYFCDDEKEHLLSLHGQFGSLELFHNTNIFLHQLVPLRTQVNHHVASVTRHERNPDVWGLVNRTDHAWPVFGSSQTSIEPGKTLTLRKGTTFYAYGLPIRIERR